VSAEHFTIAFAPGVTITKWTSAMQERHPKVGLSFVPTTPVTQIAVLHRQEADVSFVRLPIVAFGLSVIPLYEETAVVVLPRDHRLADLETVTLADLVGEDLRPPSMDAVELVAIGGGIVVLPQSIARLAPRKDVVVRSVTDAPTTRIAIAWCEDRTTAEVEEFVGIVRGRTANSSRSSAEAPVPTAKKAVPAKVKPRAIAGRTRPRKPRRR